MTFSRRMIILNVIYLEMISLNFGSDVLSSNLTKRAIYKPDLESIFINTIIDTVTDSPYSAMNYILISDIECKICSAKPFEFFTFKGTIKKIKSNYEKKGKQKERNVYFLQLDTISQFPILIKITKSDPHRFISIFINNQDIFNNLKKYLIENKLFNVLIFKRSTHGEFFVYTPCAYCNKGFNVVQYFSTWRKSSGFSKPLTLNSDFKDSFFGGILKVGITNQPGFSYIKEISKDGSPVYGGSDIKLLQLFEEKFNFKAAIATPQDTSFGTLKNGKWSGVMGMLQRGEADLVGMPKHVDFLTYQYADPTPIYAYGRFELFTAKPTVSNKMTSGLSEFSSLFWILFVLSFVITIIALWVVKYFTPNSKPITVNDALYVVISLLLWKSVNLTNSEKSVILLLGCYIISSFFQVNLYFGALTSVRLSPSYSRKPIDTIQDLHESKMDVYIIPNSAPTLYFYSLLGLDKPPKFASITDGLNAILENPMTTAFYFEGRMVKSYIDSKLLGSPNMPFYYTDKMPNYPIIVAWHMQKYCVFKKAFDKFLYRLLAGNIWDGKLEPDTIAQMQELNIIANAVVPKKVKKAKLTLTLEASWIYFIGMFLGYGFSAFVLLLEVVYNFGKSKLEIVSQHEPNAFRFKFTTSIIE